MKKYTADFETTVDLQDCRVWAYAISEIGDPDNFIYGNSLDDFMEWTKNPNENPVLYFHNLKFDSAFILDWLLTHGYEWIEDKKDRADLTFTTLITEMGAFYSVEIYHEVKGHRVNKVTINDSLKILNFSVEKIAKDFNLPIRKLELDYKTSREVGHVLTTHEVDYIRNDVEIMSRALNIMFETGLKKMTIGSDALSNFKDTCRNFTHYFPVLPVEIDSDIRLSYKGGFTYLNPAWAGKETPAGIVFDVNSMYPAVLHNKELPFDMPEPFEGKYQHDALYPLYMQNLTCSFELKKGKIPSIQLKHTMGFMPNQYIESSDGLIVELHLCSPDLQLFFDQYNVKNITYHGGWKFKSNCGFFTNYIDYWTQEKIKAKKEKNGSMYKISKLMLNSLYGKFASSTRDIKKYPYMGEDGIVKFGLTELKEKEPIYTALASFTTAYARSNIIRSSQIIRDWSLKHKGFDAYVYSDTDSIHCILNDDDAKELSKFMDIDSFKLGAWDLESHFARGKFLRQKCYIEDEITDEGIKTKTTIAGFPKQLSHLVNYDNFKEGFTTANFTKDEIGEHAKLRYQRVKGGVVLVDTDFTIK